jgi:hypothetical protein
MRSIGLTVAAITVLAAVPAFAQSPAPAMSPPPAALGTVTGARPGNDIGTGQSLPTSNRASNIDATDTRGTIAPRLPAPSISEDAPPHDFLIAARQALAANRTGEAQEALERAESRTLNRSVRPSMANDPSHQPLVAQIGQARDALASGDRARTIQLIDTALANPEATAR